ncbi:hypothetical protein F4X86_00500 [Candidatus Saccharibacteria bacterium]|nr:hypothetical protein [Candidatus Saccharibacteria bacterium]
MSSEKPARSPSLESFLQLMEVMDRHDRVRIEGLLQLAEIHERTANLQEGFIKDAETLVREREPADTGVAGIIKSSRRGRLTRARREAADSRQTATKYREQAALLQYQLSRRQLSLSNSFSDGRSPSS